MSNSNNESATLTCPVRARIAATAARLLDKAEAEYRAELTEKAHRIECAKRMIKAAAKVAKSTLSDSDVTAVDL